MTILVEPGLAAPTHHVSFSDGETTIGFVCVDANGDANPFSITSSPVPRTAMKTTTGNQKYSDFEPPWTPLDQEDFTGGMGLLDFDKDVTRFLDGRGANSMFGKIFIAPQPQYTYGFRSDIRKLPGSVKWISVGSGNRKYLAGMFQPSTTITAANVSVFVRRRGTPTAALTLELRSDSSGNPGSVIISATIATTDIPDTLSEFFRKTFTPTALTSGTVYWLVAYSTTGDSDNYWQVGVSNAAGTGKESVNGSTWGASAVDIYYRFTDAKTGFLYKFFQYKRAQYAIQQTNSGAPKLFINGDRGAADANTGTLTKLIDATKTWVTNRYQGAVVVIIKGTGSNEAQPWRKVVSNDATSLTVDSAWTITHDTTTEYIIQGAPDWTEITGHGLTAPVTDVLVNNDIIYFAQGDFVVLRRSRFYNNSGTWTAEHADDGTNKAQFIVTVRDSTAGVQIWRGQNMDATSMISVSMASVVTWGTALTFGTAMTFTDPWGKINRLIEYGDTTKQLWILREGSIFTVNGTKIDELQIIELHTAMEYTNGIAAMVHNVYIYFNIGRGLERYYNNQMDDIGPNRDDGLPAIRQGTITTLLGYPGRFFCGIDAGPAGMSSLMVNNLTGWHSYYQAPMPGDAITSLAFQTVPGTTPDRLWVAVGDDLLWLPMPSSTMDPTRDASSIFAHEGSLTTGYMSAGMVDIWKFAHSLKIVGLGLDAGHVEVEADYQIDQETTWTPIPYTFTVSPIDEQNLQTTLGVNNKQIALRFRLQTDDCTRTPIIKTYVLETISRVPVKESYALNVRLEENDSDLNGERDDFSYEVKSAFIKKWANEVTPLTMRCVMAEFDNTTIFIDPPPKSPRAETIQRYMLRITATEA